MNRIVIVDYGMGNLFSIYKRLKQLGSDPVISYKADIIKGADKIILPGVGHFKVAMKNLIGLDLIPLLNEEVLVKKKPILGICLGMQLMATRSEEGTVEGLNWFDAEVVRFQAKDKLKYKVPHMGWNQIIQTKNSALMKDIPAEAEFYFVHSYYIKAQSEDILNQTEYEEVFTSAIENDNIFGVQYHPEKSQEPGNLLLKNFVML